MDSKAKHTCKNYELVHNILCIWKKTYKYSENIRQPIKPLWLSMGISAKNEEHLINATTNSSTYLEIGQNPVMEHGLLM